MSKKMFRKIEKAKDELYEFSAPKKAVDYIEKMNVAGKAYDAIQGQSLIADLMRVYQSKKHYAAHRNAWAIINKSHPETMVGEWKIELKNSSGIMKKVS